MIQPVPKKVYIYVMVMLSFLCQEAYAVSSLRIDSLMNKLDSVVADRENFSRLRESHIATLKRDLKAATDDSVRYELLGNLFDTYKPYNTYSAYYYSLQRENVARKIGNPVFVANARMNQANVLSAVGMYHGAMSIVNSIDAAILPDYLLPHYFYTRRTLAGNLGDFAAFSTIRAEYNALTNSYRDSVMSVNDPASLAYIITKADKYNSFGQYDKAVETMNDFMSKNDLSEHEKAICAWTLAESYRYLNDAENQKEQLIISSIGDLKAAVREYVSLRHLALLLYKEGDLERAYRFMNIAMDDATKCNARQRIVELNGAYPEISGIYVDKIKKQQHSLMVALWIITFLSLVVVVTLVYVWKQMKVISKSRSDLAVANDKLNSLNEELMTSNENLSVANVKLSESNSRLNEAIAGLSEANRKLSCAYKEIAENSSLKEFYIGRYMEECMSYIDNLDSYRKSLLKLAGTGKLADVKDKLKSTEILDVCLKNFYADFDSTFLKLFPTFVEDFNKLLLDEERIVPKREGALSTELRIFALIRLGITDSDKIAKFLHYSLTTIYNYRTRVRNKARNERAALEAEVMKIGLAKDAKNTL